MIEVENLSKRYGDKVAVDGLTFTVHPGVVTGFLGPNGAGKSTTLRMIAGLDVPTSGQVRVNGRDYRSSRAPMAELGLLLEAKSVHPGRSARDHLLAIAQTAGIGKARVNQVIELVGLGDVARKPGGRVQPGHEPAGGHRRRAAGPPRTVVLDEPVNGLDPEGVRWIRALLRTLADEGCTVFYSSHLMSEMAQTAKNLIVIGRGRLIADSTVEQFIAATTAASVVVRSPEPGGCAACSTARAHGSRRKDRTCFASTASRPRRSAPSRSRPACPSSISGWSGPRWRMPSCRPRRTASNMAPPVEGL